MDCVRAACPESVMFEVVETEIFIQHIWPLMQRLIEDPCWKVRFACFQRLREVSWSH